MSASLEALMPPKGDCASDCGAGDEPSGAAAFSCPLGVGSRPLLTQVSTAAAVRRASQAFNLAVRYWDSGQAALAHRTLLGAIATLQRERLPLGCVEHTLRVFRLLGRGKTPSPWSAACKAAQAASATACSSARSVKRRFERSRTFFSLRMFAAAGESQSLLLTTPELGALRGGLCRQEASCWLFFFCRGGVRGRAMFPGVAALPRAVAGSRRQWIRPGSSSCSPRRQVDVTPPLPPLRHTRLHAVPPPLKSERGIVRKQFKSSSSGASVRLQIGFGESRRRPLNAARAAVYVQLPEGVLERRLGETSPSAALSPQTNALPAVSTPLVREPSSLESRTQRRLPRVAAVPPGSSSATAGADLTKDAK